MSEKLPALVVVTGRPGSGKTSLAHELARTIHCPLISRDEMKEGFVNTIGEVGSPGHDEIARHIYNTFFDAIELLLSRRITIVAEAAFQHKRWAPKLELLQQIARLRMIVCQVDPELARRRHVERGLADANRERFHGDPAVQAAREGVVLPIEPYDPPHIANVPLLTVDTSNGYQPGLDAIAAFARG